VDHYGEFLGYFMIRKVTASRQQLEDAGTVTKKLASWLADQGHLDRDSAADAREQSAEAGRDLPRADNVAELLYRVAAISRRVADPGDVSDDDWVEDYLPITRVEPGKL
jgi:hypothetical protein